jgi:NAD(P)-dependent dehydrogenase (short-subunit alcohol dehydrogenase family)
VVVSLPTVTINPRAKNTALIGIRRPITTVTTKDGKHSIFRYHDCTKLKRFFVAIRPNSLLKRFTSIEEVVSLVIFMASPLSSATTGTALRKRRRYPLDHLKHNGFGFLAFRTSYGTTAHRGR